MNNTCKSCYWKRPDGGCTRHQSMSKDACEKYNPICKREEDVAEYKYKGEYYCANCILEKFNVEESTIINYYRDGEYIGSDEDMEEVVGNLDIEIEILDY